MRVRQPLQQRIRHEHGGAEHGALRQWAKLRRLLRDQVRERQRVVPPGLRRRDRHQLLPPEQRRRVVQRPPAALRPLPAGFPAHRAV